MFFPLKLCRSRQADMGQHYFYSRNNLMHVIYLNKGLLLKQQLRRTNKIDKQRECNILLLRNKAFCRKERVGVERWQFVSGL